jgi:hypothetical protein
VGCLCKVVDMCRGFVTLSAHTCLKTDSVNWKKVRLWLICKTNYCVQPRHSRLINYLAVCRRRAEADICIPSHKKCRMSTNRKFITLFTKTSTDFILKMSYQIHAPLPCFLENSCPSELSCDDIRHILCKCNKKWPFYFIINRNWL